VAIQRLDSNTTPIGFLSIVKKVILIMTFSIKKVEGEKFSAVGTILLSCWLDQKARTDMSFLLFTLNFNPVWHGIGKQEECSSLGQPRGNF
jgi:hypothetical protein